MRLKVKGKKYKIDLAKFDKIAEGVYHFRVEFSEPKRFEYLTGIDIDFIKN